MKNDAAMSAFAGHFVSAPWRSSGKSVVSMGLARAATRCSLGVQTYKKGPDYIDPLWLKAASYNACYNLDPYLQSDVEMHQTYAQNLKQMVLVEGTMGFHDGLCVDGSDSNCGIAKRLGLPVILVIDCRGMHRTIAALVNGIVQFDPNVNYTGLVLNRIRSSRHASKIESALKTYCDVDVLGVVAENAELHIDERELGLVPAADHPAVNRYIDTVADTLEASIDLEQIFNPNKQTSTETIVPACAKEFKSESAVLTVGIARDEAFHFYYEDDLALLRSRGVRLVEFSPMRDSFPTGLDAVLLGGGFPERHATALSENESCRAGLAQAIASGMPVRAECGGLMYLCRSIEVDNVVLPMVGVIDAAVTMQASPQGRGYMRLAPNSDSGDSTDEVAPFPAHEFHHSVISFESEPEFAYCVRRGHGVNGEHDGVCVHNVVASYAHFRHTASTPWVDWFLKSIHSSIQSSKQGTLRTINHV